MTEELKVFKAI